MISLTVDEGYAFDYYSICMVKYRKGLLPYSVFSITENDLKGQIGKNIFELIVASTEFDDLLLANTNTFDIVERAKEDRVKASEVDASNYKRFLCKQSLQRKFFPKEKHLEVKN